MILVTLTHRAFRVVHIVKQYAVDNGQVFTFLPTLTVVVYRYPSVEIHIF